MRGSGARFLPSPSGAVLLLGRIVGAVRFDHRPCRPSGGWERGSAVALPGGGVEAAQLGLPLLGGGVDVLVELAQRCTVVGDPPLDAAGDAVRAPRTGRAVEPVDNIPAEGRTCDKISEPADHRRSLLRRVRTRASALRCPMTRRTP